MKLATDFVTFLLDKDDLASLEDELITARTRLAAEKPWNFHNEFPRINRLFEIVRSEREKYHRELGI